MTTENPLRIEYGLTRSVCACPICVNNCKFMPGYLSVLDLERLTPAGLDGLSRLEWAKVHLRASEGAKLLGADGQIYPVPTLVPASRTDFSCHWLNAENRCEVHSDSPFGCAMFSCKDSLPSGRLTGLNALIALFNEWRDLTNPYPRTWLALRMLGLNTTPLEERKKAARNAHEALQVSGR